MKILNLHFSATGNTTTIATQTNETAKSVGEEKNYSEETSRQIDAEVREIIQAGHDRTRVLLEKHRPTLDALSPKLEEQEILAFCAPIFLKFLIFYRKRAMLFP